MVTKVTHITLCDTVHVYTKSHDLNATKATYEHISELCDMNEACSLLGMHHCCGYQGKEPCWRTVKQVRSDDMLDLMNATSKEGACETKAPATVQRKGVVCNVYKGSGESGGSSLSQSQ